MNGNAGIVEGCRNSAIGSYAAESVVHHPIYIVTTYNVTWNTSNICMIRITFLTNHFFNIKENIFLEFNLNIMFFETLANISYYYRYYFSGGGFTDFLNALAAYLPIALFLAAIPPNLITVNGWVRWYMFFKYRIYQLNKG